MVAATRRPARRTAVRVGPAGRGRRVCGGAGPESNLRGLRNQEGEKASSRSTSSPSCCPGLSRAPTPRQFPLDPRQERRLLSKAIHSNSSSSSATMPEHHSAIRQTRSEGRRGRRQAPSNSPARPHHCLPPFPHTTHSPSDAPSAATAPPCPGRPPQAPPPPHRSCRRAPDVALRRQLLRDPYPAPTHTLRPRRAGPTRTAVRRAGRRVAATIPAPSRAGRRSVIIAALHTQ